MNPAKVKKNIDYSKINIGTELECQIVKSDSLEQIGKKESQQIFKELMRSLHWEMASGNEKEIVSVSKKLSNYETEIKLDLGYSTLEISTVSPLPDLELLEKVYAQALLEFRRVLNSLGLMIWPFGVAPAASGLFRLPFKPKEEYTDVFFGPLNRIEYLGRFCHITSQQINIDVPVQKIIPAINALYRNLGNIIEKFANSPLLRDGKLYKEGRFYFWNDLPEIKSNPARYLSGVAPVFPKKPLKNFQDFYSWVWQSEYFFVMRNGEAHTFKDATMSSSRFLKEKQGIALTPEGKELVVKLESADIELMFKFNWLDFKPHFDFKDFTIETFFEYWGKKDLDGFLDKYTDHAYLEIRPCPVHFENNAMDIPRYFYNIFQNLDKYIKDSEKIDWETARKNREKAILA